MKLGDIINGDEVVGILRADIYCHFYKVPSAPAYPWDDAHPGWRDGDVVLLRAVEPRIPFTFEEWLGMQTEGMPLEVAKQRYSEQPKAANMWVPSVALS
jgi:hypothetical protein